MKQSQLTDFATRYAAAWSSQDAESLAAFYAEDGSLQVNADPPAVGRDAVRALAQGFMTAFPDMTVQLESVVQTAESVRFNWLWTGTNTGEMHGMKATEKPVGAQGVSVAWYTPMPAAATDTDTCCRGGRVASTATSTAAMPTNTRSSIVQP